LQPGLIDREMPGREPAEAVTLPQRMRSSIRACADGLAAVGEHNRQIHGDPARLMHRAALPQPAQRIGETAAQPGDFSDISKQAGAGTTDHTATATRDCNLRTRTGTLHSESAFRAGRSGP
jgi:hypothetical protein